MKRRDFLALAVGAAAQSPVRSWAQRTTTIPRVGVLWHAADADGEWPYYGCLREGFEELGYSQGKIDLLQAGDDFRDGRLSNAKFAGGLRHAATLHDREKDLEVAKAEAPADAIF